MNKIWRAAILGLGNIAWKLDKDQDAGFPAMTHAKALQREERAVLVGGCSPDPEEQSGFSQAFDVPSFSTVEEVLGQCSPDLVSICTSSQLHGQHVMQCIEAGIPLVWLEKPPAQSTRELREMLEFLDRQGNKTRISVNYQRRYQDTYNRLKALYAEKSFGGCRGINITYSRGLETNGSHMLDVLYHIIGDSDDIVLEWVSPGNGESPSFSLGGPDAVPIMVMGMDLPYHCVDISLVFEQGRASVIHGGMTLEMEQRIEHEFCPGFYRLCSKPHDISAEQDLLQGMQRALTDLIDSAEQQRQPLSNLLTAQRTQKLMEDIRKLQGRSRA